MARDYYAEAREIAKRLASDGLTSEAQVLVDAIDTGSTATEILMALRWHLKRIDESNPVTSPQTRHRIRDLQVAISDALDV